MKYRKLLLLILSLILICGGCTTGRAMDETKDETESSSVEIENTNFTTEAESETKKLELSIDITDYFPTDKEGVSNHYYIAENHVLWGTGTSKDGLLIYVTEEHQLYGLGEASFGIFPEIHEYEEKQRHQDEYA